MSPERPLDLDTPAGRDRLRSLDTVVVAFPDMQGRLQGKRVHGRFFLDHVPSTARRAAPTCSRSTSIWPPSPATPSPRGSGGMATCASSSISRPCTAPRPGLLRDGARRCRVARRVRAGRAGTAVGAPCPGRCTAARWGFTAFVGTELEFLVFETPYDQAWDRRYTDLTPASRYNVDYSILGGTWVEPLLRDIRNAMYAAGMSVESARGVQPRPARDRLPVRPGPRHVRQAHGLQDRRQGDRRGARGAR